MEALLELDKNIFVFLNSLGSTDFDFIWMFITDKKSSIPLYIFLLVFLFKKTKQKLYKMKKILLFLVNRLKNDFLKINRKLIAYKKAQM